MNKQTTKQELTEINKLIFLKKYDAAWTQIDRLSQTPSCRDEVLVHLRQIELAAKLRKMSELYSRFEQLSHQQPTNHFIKTVLILLEIHTEATSSDEIMAKINLTMNEHPNFAPIFYAAGFCLELQGNIDRAIFNYKRCIELSDEWYPAYFGLSQLYYHKGDSQQGDQYFLIFESLAKYNVYGNFETHRALFNECMSKEQFADAESAITSLSNWWIENKGSCPEEIKIYEDLTIAKIANAVNDHARATKKTQEAVVRSQSLLHQSAVSPNVLYFVAKTFEDHGHLEEALACYKKALAEDAYDPANIQKIGGHFLSLGELKLARDLFQNAYERFPDSVEVKFCLLICNLKESGVAVEEYLIGRERLKQLTANNTDSVETLALLHSLLSRFQGDSEVHMNIADQYLKLGNIEKAKTHFRKMHELDKLSHQSRLKYIAFELHYGSLEDAYRVLNELKLDENATKQTQAEHAWLRASYHAKQMAFEISQQELSKATAIDPWNVSYLTQEIINRTMLSNLDQEWKKTDSAIANLLVGDEQELDWRTFDTITQKLEALNVADIVYARKKLRFLYVDGAEEYVPTIVKAAIDFDPNRGVADFLKLLNTNFDSPAVFLALGILHKELWQLETSLMWLNQLLLQHNLRVGTKAQCLLEIAENNIWLERDLKMAVEYAKMSVELTGSESPRAANILAYAYIKTGQLKLAESKLSNDPKNTDFDLVYLRGLIEYRNGARKKANEIWKPLLTVPPTSRRAYTIKQDILKYYFDGTPYLKVH